MAQVIQCPTCAKKFKLPDRPPATFTCTGCATVMDLSAFRTAAAAAPAAEPAAAGAAAAGAGAGGARSSGSATRTTRSAEGGSGAGTGSKRTSSARRRAREDDDGDREGLPPPKDNSKVLLLGSLAAFVVIGLVAFLVLNKDKPAPPPAPVDPNAPTAGTTAPLPPPTAGTTPTPKGTTPTPGTSTPTPAPTGSSDTPEPAPDKPATPSKPGTPGIVKEVGHHPDATEEEKKNIDHLIDVAIFQNAGRDSREAEQQLITIGLKAAPRLINVFNTVKLQEGFENRLGKMKAGIADRALRSIDGYVDRASRGKVTLVTAASDPKFVETIAKRWNMWWENGYYKEPKKPWDERTEGNRGEKADPTDKDGSGTTDGK